MKNFKFVKVFLMALGVCSFAFSGVKAAPPPGSGLGFGGLAPEPLNYKRPPWLMSDNIETWNCLPTYIKYAIINYQKYLVNTFPKVYNEFKTKDKFEIKLSLLDQLINMGSNDDEKDNIRRVIGFYPHPNGNKNKMYINNAQLSIFLSHCKNSLNKRFLELGYSWRKIIRFEHIFFYKMPFDEVRYWNIRVQDEHLPRMAKFVMPADGGSSAPTPLPAQAEIRPTKKFISPTADPREFLN